MSSFVGALNKIGDAYVLGCVAFYEKMEQDPWQQAHDDLDTALLTESQAVLDVAVISFERQCLDLIKAFKATGIQSKRRDLRDALVAGDRAERIHNTREKRCSKCEEQKQDLKIIPVGETEIELVCGACLAVR